MFYRKIPPLSVDFLANPAAFPTSCSFCLARARRMVFEFRRRMNPVLLDQFRDHDYSIRYEDPVF
ncbi:hypothetical protein LEP1GSC047_3718 [Leptospira inadai serovar Lyme str. 10]|uniref:Uncharacterized protein n=1 Tax=Leptospira inadai serovar Lyme str. 10 TaxID=1049790 RepID=V6HL76_9LEPT|nr:hypothetical protein LEP1GSC047_3718 [Leptospira inadai serovar Lyme str. 10]